ncbi:serine protease [Sphingomonas cannabina]|uniref:S1C family serine protease n=1 Tax=Sphingomonas cannabina TaxID=2899123 RepID=UPI001F40F23F|nr:serine protease [Sphingomonas cannabina]UIJ46721.1 serine protease [Sphingomonas cannabina]
MRFLLALFALLAFATPAHADDIAAAGRGVVRVVTIAVVEGEVVGFGHGSGFAVAPNRIVTNAHVVEPAARYPDNVLIGVVPSAGDKSYQGKLIAVDPARDLALIEFSGVSLPPLTLYAGPADEGDALIALGYPGNVDVATAQSMSDFIRPQSPVRSQGVYSGARSIAGVNMLLHTANIARGNSGGPLLDRCGRVIGVNSAITNGEQGDANFGFAIADSELTAFLREAKQPVASVGVPCLSIEDRLAADSAAAASAREQAEADAAAVAAQTRADREAALDQARDRNLTIRENFIGGATLLLVLGALGLGGAGLLATRRDPRARQAAIAGGALMAVAVIVFFLRPGFDPASVKVAAPKTRTTAADSGTGRMICTLDPARSRVTVSATQNVALSYGGDGCINGRTQYAEDGHGGWERVLVPDEEATVSVLGYQPATRTYTSTRYLLGDEAMSRARELRKGVTLKTCSADPAARAALASQQSAIRSSLPQRWNERLVYSCKAVP